MRPRRTRESNFVLKLPDGTEDNDLWAQARGSDDGAVVVLSTWEPSAAERAAIARGENVELIVWGLVHPPVAVRTTDAELGRWPEGETRELLDALRAIGAEVVEDDESARVSHCERPMAYETYVGPIDVPDRVSCEACGAAVVRVGVSADYVAQAPAENVDNPGGDAG